MFSSYELSETFLWEETKGKILMNLPIQGQGNQALLQSVRVTDVTVRTHAWCVQMVTQCVVLWCLFNCETWHASAESTPGSSAFVWKNPDQTAKLRYAWLPCHLWKKLLPLMVLNDFLVNSYFEIWGVLAATNNALCTLSVGKFMIKSILNYNTQWSQVVFKKSRRYS